MKRVALESWWRSLCSHLGLNHFLALLNFSYSLGPDPNMITPSHWRDLDPQKLMITCLELQNSSAFNLYQLILLDKSFLTIILTCLALQLVMSLNHCSMVVAEPLQHCWMSLIYTYPTLSHQSLCAWKTIILPNESQVPLSTNTFKLLLGNRSESVV